MGFRTSVLCIAFFLCAIGIQQTSGTASESSLGVWHSNIGVFIVKGNRSPDTLNYDRLEKLFNFLINFTKSQGNVTFVDIDIAMYLIDRGRGRNNTAFHGTKRFGHLVRNAPSGSSVVSMVKEAMRSDPVIVWDTVEGSVQRRNLLISRSGQQARGELLVWIAEDTTKYEPKDVYDQLVNRLGFKSIGLTEQEVASTIEKIRRSGTFSWSGLLE